MKFHTPTKTQSTTSGPMTSIGENRRFASDGTSASSTSSSPDGAIICIVDGGCSSTGGSTVISALPGGRG